MHKKIEKRPKKGAKTCSKRGTWQDWKRDHDRPEKCVHKSWKGAKTDHKREPKQTQKGGQDNGIWAMWEGCRRKDSLVVAEAKVNRLETGEWTHGREQTARIKLEIRCIHKNNKYGSPHTNYWQFEYLTIYTIQRHLSFWVINMAIYSQLVCIYKHKYYVSIRTMNMSHLTNSMNL